MNGHIPVFTAGNRISFILRQRIDNRQGVE